LNQLIDLCDTENIVLIKQNKKFVLVHSILEHVVEHCRCIVDIVIEFVHDPNAVD